MNDSKDMKVIFGVIIGIVVIAVLGITISTYNKGAKSDFVAPTSTPEVIIGNTATSTATSTGQKAISRFGKTIAPEAWTLVSNVEKSAGLNYPITKQVFNFNYVNRSVKLSGYGFSYNSASSTANKGSWNKMNAFLSEAVGINILNSGSTDSKIRTYSSMKFVCVAFERPATADVLGSVTTSVHCAESSNIVK